MKKIKLFKTLLIPSLGVLTLGTIAAVATSCGRGRVSVVGVSLNETKISLNVGDSKRLEAFVYPDAATDKSVTWTSSNETVATVDKNGNVTAVAVGTATITVTTNDGGKTDTCQVTVEPVHVDGVTLNESSIVLDAGNTKTLIATVLPENATDKSVTWTSSNETVATVDKNGNVTAVAVGTATITVTTNDGAKTDTCQVTVEPVHVESVTLNESSANLYVDETKTLIATVLPENATDKSVTWISSNETVATVENGKVTAVRGGTATITVTTNDGHYTDTCIVTITFLPYVGVVANADSTLELINHDNNPNLQYSTDDGTSWNTYSGEISISQGQTLLLKGNNPEGWSTKTTTYSNFNITGDVSLSGNIMALIDNGKGTAIAAIPNEYCFYSLFGNSTGITSVSKDFLSATTLADSCYYGMFDGCTNLRNAPEFPATTLAYRCYYSMFRGCVSLTTAPELPATTLAENCYFCMFQNCTSLTQAPELPATTLQGSCYEGMFYGCSSLNSIRIGYTGKAAEAPTFAFDDWVKGVADTGTFYYKGNDTPANFGFPEDWTVNPLLTNNQISIY